MGISAAECGHWRTLFSHNYHFKSATWGSTGKCWGELTCITSGFNLKVFQSRKARDQIQVPRLMKPEASLQEMLCWNLLFSGGLAWSFKVRVAGLHCGNRQLASGGGCILLVHSAMSTVLPSWSYCPYLLFQWVAIHININLGCASKTQHKPQVVVICCSQDIYILFAMTPV